MRPGAVARRQTRGRGRPKAARDCQLPAPRCTVVAIGRVTVHDGWPAHYARTSRNAKSYITIYNLMLKVKFYVKNV